MLALLVAVLLGVLFGYITGMIPGFHANNVALIAIWAAAVLELDPLLMSVVLVSTGTTHAIVDFIPSIFLGAPSEGTALAVAPGHRMLMSGRGFEALALSVVGGVFGIVLVLLGFVFLRAFSGAAYSFTSSYLGVILVAVSAIMILIEKRMVIALGIFLLSGLYGLLSLNSPINQSVVLLPVLSGLFGASTLILSYSNAPSIPKQAIKTNIPIKEAMHGGVVGFFGGILAGFLPGVGTSQSAIIVQRLTGMRGARKFIIVLGAIGAADVLLSLLALQFIGRARSGIAAAVERLYSGFAMGETYLFLGVGLLAAGLAAVAALKTGAAFARGAAVRDTKKVSGVIFVFLLLLCAMFTGCLGVVVFFTGCAIGVLPHVLKTKKSLLISCLLLPTMLYFTGTDRVVLVTLGI